jgi:hypothetical protein
MAEKEKRSCVTLILFTTIARDLQGNELSHQGHQVYKA